MTAKTILSCIASLILLCSHAYAQKKETTSVKVDIKQDTVINYKKPQKSITHGSVTVEGNKINYEAIAGTLVLKNNLDTPTCSMFYVAYFKEGGDATQRPLTFIYNGGPGSSTIWLHMGAWGPQRVYLNDTSRTKAPYKTVNNDYSLLDASDLVFIDAPGTGFGEVLTKQRGGAGLPKDFFGIDQDAHAFANFITQFLSDFNRWDSPKYLFGESYGTTRSAVLSNILQGDDNVSLNGVILLSQIFSFGNDVDPVAKGNPGDDQPYRLALPSYTATAWYHHKLPNQPEKLEPLLKEVENFSMNEYAQALNQGSLLDSIAFNNIAEKLHNYTGLPVNYIKKANLRVTGPQFEQALLGDENKITGRLDSRFTGDAVDPLSEYSEYDPLSSFTGAAFTATFNNYVRTDLGFGKNIPYKVRGNVWPWDFKRQRNFFPNVVNDLAQAMIYNPDLKVMLNMGYFDLGTPYFEGEYEMHHLPIPNNLQKNIEFDTYYSGHMVYLHPESLKQLHDNVAKFISKTL